MKVEINNGPGAASATVELVPTEVLTAEGGAMIAMTADTRVETTTRQRGKGGMMGALRRALAGENFFINQFTAGPAGGQVWLATPLPGDMMVMDLKDESWVVQSGAWVASEEGVNIDVGWRGIKSAFSGERLFWLNVQGSGQVVINSYGAIYPVDIDGAYIVDTGHIVAFPEHLDFKIDKAGGSFLSAILGGEGLVCRFEGQGRIWCQSHNETGFGQALGPLLPST